MPTPTYIALANYTVPAGGKSSVTFSNIPSTYRDLVLTVNSTLETYTSGNGKGATVMRINSDVNSNYSHLQMSEDVNGPLSTSGTETYINFMISSYEDDVTPTMYVANIFDYAQTDKHKVITVRGGLTAGNQYPRTLFNTYKWASTSPISSLSLFSIVSGGLYNPGTTFGLYGVAA